MAPFFLVLPVFAVLFAPSEAAVTARVNQVNSWNGGGQFSVVLSNSGPGAVCAVTYRLTLPSGTTISSSWNMVSAGSSQFRTESWVNIAAGGTDSSGGFNVNGGGTPTVSVVSSSACGGSGGSATTTTTARATTTTRAGATTTTTRASATTTTTASSGGSSGTTLTVAPDASNTAINSCYQNNATGPIIAQLNRPISNGIFTFYGAGGTGACGMNSGLPAMSAAASGTFFSGGSWVPPCTGSQYIYNNAVCVNKCVRITYTCVGCSAPKTLTVPINNQCPECAVDHVDLSQAAFNWLEPQGGTVGIARGATITYINC